MRIKTRFNRDAPIYFMLKNKLHYERVSAILINVTEDDKVYIHYAVPVTSEEEDYTLIHEMNAFDTIDKLFDALKERFDAEPNPEGELEKEPNAEKYDEVVFD
jgi:hypothetical protein